MIELRANGCAAFAQYKPSAEGRWEPWALQVVEVGDGKITGIHHWIPPFAAPLFEKFGVPPYLEGDLPYSSERASSSS
jgi:RNA polymerase sigma-70 factor (ECF subfamily)